MKKITRITLLGALLLGQMYVTFATGGNGKKKTAAVINIKPSTSFTSSLNFNLHNGMKYTGSLINTSSASGMQNTLVTYQKGNSVYIIPYKQKIFVADVHQGYAGTKLIIRVP